LSTVGAGDLTTVHLVFATPVIRLAASACSRPPLKAAFTLFTAAGMSDRFTVTHSVTLGGLLPLHLPSDLNTVTPAAASLAAK
jgi:hypothetical protein